MEAFLEWFAPVWRPHEGQREFLLCPNKIRVLACGRRWGKTDACAAAILGELFQDKPTRHLILAPTLGQAQLLFDRVVELLDCLKRDLHPPAPSSVCRDKTSQKDHLAAAQTEEGEVKGHLVAAKTEEGEIKVKRSPYPKLSFNGHTVIARSGHVGRSLRGNEATHVIIDEAAYVPESLVTEVAMPMLATNDGRLALISTPCGLNHFWKFFKMGEASEHGVWSRTAPSSESPYVSPEFLAVQRELISERAFATEYEAQFVDFAGAVFSTEVIESCIVPEVVRGEVGFAAGVDWGRYHDYTAVAVLEGDRNQCQLVSLEQFKDESWSSMVGRVAHIIGGFPSAPVSADSTAMGDPVVESLSSALTGHAVTGVTLTMANKGTLVGDLRMAMERRAIVYPPISELIRQLTHFEMKVTESGHRQTGARSGYHDDLVIALVLAYHQLPISYTAPVLVGDEKQFSGRKRLRFEDLVWGGITT